jgi:hypothetical protein
MRKVNIGAAEVAKVIEMLRTLGSRGDVSSDVRSNSTYWSSAMRGRMDRRDLETVAWLLSEIGNDRRLPAADRRSAHYWATYLEAQL